MKVIDILVKIANGEALPEKIKFENHIYYAYHYENRIIDYYYKEELKNQITLFEDSMRNYGITSYLNDEVEIIEEENKIPEKIKDKYCSQISKVELAQKYNEIIDYLHYLKSKGE